MTRKIQEVDEDFDLVMITELMSESLVLLAHLLCVPLYQVVGLVNNSRRKNERSSE